MSILEIRDISSGYGEVQILWGTSLSLQPGNLTSLVGGNGVGKTTLLRSVMGLVRPWNGSIWFEGVDVSHLPPYSKAEMGLVLVPEGRQLFTDMSVAENLEMGATPKHAKERFKENLNRVYEMFPRLKERKDQKAGTLSGGEQQMLAMGRALMSAPKLLLLDEPSLGLSPIMCGQIAAIIRNIHAEGRTVVLVEQNARLALALAQQAYVIETGDIVLSGPAEELRVNDEVKKAYLGG
jgi:branched-chain amino acid transport system ATP-binding protein